LERPDASKGKGCLGAAIQGAGTNPGTATKGKATQLYSKVRSKEGPDPGVGRPFY
jgi:hypothetical protein